MNDAHLTRRCRREVSTAAERQRGKRISSHAVIKRSPQGSPDDVPFGETVPNSKESGDPTYTKGDGGRSQRMLRALPSAGGSPSPTLWSFFINDTNIREVTPNGN
jgi:hypothetical protein